MAKLVSSSDIGRGAIIAAAVLAIGPGTHALAQSASTEIQGIVWKELERMPLASDPSKEESIGIAVIQPGTPADRHSHAEVRLCSRSTESRRARSEPMKASRFRRAGSTALGRAEPYRSR